MNEQEKYQIQLKLARELAIRKSAKPCVYLTTKDSNFEIGQKCEYFEFRSGCTKDEGFILNPGESVKCPDGKGPIIIGSQDLPAEDTNGKYRTEIATINTCLHPNEESRLFVNLS